MHLRLFISRSPETKPQLTHTKSIAADNKQKEYAVGLIMRFLILFDDGGWKVGPEVRASS